MSSISQMKAISGGVKPGGWLNAILVGPLGQMVVDVLSGTRQSHIASLILGR